MNLRLNEQSIEIDEAYRDEPLLWAIRDGAGLTGTKFGCGMWGCAVPARYMWTAKKCARV